MNQKPDFKEVVSDLIDNGYSPADIASECGCTETYIRALASGKAKGCGYVIGSRLMELHGAL